MNWNLYLNFLIAMLAIINPVAIVALWSELTSDVNRNVRLRLATMLIVLGFLSLVIMTSSIWFEKKNDPIIFTAITRLFGIIVTAIAVQFILEGLSEVFPNWVNKTSPVQNNKTNVTSSVK